MLCGCVQDPGPGGITHHKTFGDVFELADALAGQGRTLDAVGLATQGRAELGSWCQDHTHARKEGSGGRGCWLLQEGTASSRDTSHKPADHCTMRAVWRLRPSFAVLRQVYGRLGATAWLVAVAAGIVLIICIALWAKTAPARRGLPAARLRPP